MTAHFIEVSVDNHALPEADAREELARTCPVDIFGLDNGRVVVREENQDECTLCGLCLNPGFGGAVRVRRLYDPEEPELSATGT